ncbi:MAG: winged helix-turn-helix domain-containing protein, partial [Candidatus Acidiferrum sp.]
MFDPSSGIAKLRFGPFLADLATQELFKRGKRLKLQQQPMQVLMALLERPHVVVTREDLRTRIWPADTFVDFEHSLNTAIKKVRQALGDNASRPRFIETLPRRGYRFLKDVEATDETIASRHRQAGREVGRLFAVQSEDAMG